MWAAHTPSLGPGVQLFTEYMEVETHGYPEAISYRHACPLHPFTYAQWTPIPAQDGHQLIHTSRGPERGESPYCHCRFYSGT